MNCIDNHTVQRWIEDLNHNNRWKVWLKRQEFRLLNTIVKKHWKEFWNNEPIENGPVLDDDFVFRVRSLVFQLFLEEQFYTDKDQHTPNEKDNTNLDNNDSNVNAPNINTVEDDENYDDDDEDLPNADSESASGVMDEDVEDDDDDDDDDDEGKLDITKISDEDAMLYLFENTIIYQSLEHESDENMLKLVKESLKPPESSVASESNRGSTTKNSESSGVEVQKAEAFKYLMEHIESNRYSLKLSNNEINRLFSEVRKTRSKWADDEKIGQEDLYKACERVIHDLRNYAEHSTPFLSRVSKREAPDYYILIKHPMDLGTVLKNLKAFEYKSKKQFVDDLNLIWSNCLTYNSDPNHFLRVHANAMKAKADALITMIPDITVRSKSEAYMNEDDDSDRDSQTTSTVVNRKGIASTTTTSAKKTSSNSNTHHRAKSTSEGVGSSVQICDDLENISDEQIWQNGDKSLDLDLDLEPCPQDYQDRATKFWLASTEPVRVALANNRINLFPSSNLNAEHFSLHRDSLEMSIFNRNNQFPRNFKEFSEQGIDVCRVQTLDYLFSTVSIPQSSNETPVLPVEEPFSLSKIQFSSDLQNRPVFKTMIRSCATIHNIRAICNKINTLKQLQMGIPFNSRKNKKKMSTKTINFDATKFGLDVDIEHLEKHKYNQSLPDHLLERSCIVLLYHAGFEKFNSFTLTAIAEICKTYILNIAKAFQAYHENEQYKSRTARDLLIQSFELNGLDSFTSLEMYVLQDINRFDLRLHEAQKGFKKIFEGMVRPVATAAQDVSAEAAIFNSEMLSRGDFMSELGEDFFGFKELGIDKELGQSIVSLPFLMLRGQYGLQNNSSTNTSSGWRKYDLMNIKFKPITTDDIPNQIGLIQTFLKRKFEELPNTQVLPEDEESQKQKLKNNKIPSRRERGARV